MLRFARRRGVGVEVGVFAGKFAQEIVDYTRLRKLHLVDAWKYIEGSQDEWNLPQDQMDDLYNQTVAMFANTPKVNILRQQSVEAASTFANRSLDFVYIDADHRYEFVMQDLRAWAPKLKSGGMLSGHDFVDVGEKFGVRSAVLEYMTLHGGVVFETNQKWPSWYTFME